MPTPTTICSTAARRRTAHGRYCEAEAKPTGLITRQPAEARDAFPGRRVTFVGVADRRQMLDRRPPDERHDHARDGDQRPLACPKKGCPAAHSPAYCTPSHQSSLFLELAHAMTARPSAAAHIRPP